jgi:hypothetical protein
MKKAAHGKQEYRDKQNECAENKFVMPANHIEDQRSFFQSQCVPVKDADSDGDRESRSDIHADKDQEFVFRIHSFRRSAGP